MQTSNKKIFDNLVSKTKIYLIIIAVLLLAICWQNQKFIIPSIILYVLIILYTYFANNKRKSEISETLQDLTLTVDSAAKTSLINSPFSLIILETDGNVVWKSSKFASEFKDIDINSFINDIIFDLKEEIQNKKDSNDKTILKNIQVNKRTYRLVGKFVNSKTYSKNDKNKYMAILYFIDETENIKLQKEYNDSKTI
jgi:c-di-AMP phosphodiesterase-like protein